MKPKRSSTGPQTLGGGEIEDDKYEIEKLLNKYIPFFEIFDLDRTNGFLVLCLWRLYLTLTMTKMLVNPDELF